MTATCTRCDGLIDQATRKSRPTGGVCRACLAEEAVSFVTEDMINDALRKIKDERDARENEEGIQRRRLAKT